MDWHGCLEFRRGYFVFFKQKTAYEMRISDWSSDVCSSDLPHVEDDDDAIISRVVHDRMLSAVVDPPQFARAEIDRLVVDMEQRPRQALQCELVARVECRRRAAVDVRSDGLSGRQSSDNHPTKQNGRAPWRERVGQDV